MRPELHCHWGGGRKFAPGIYRVIGEGDCEGCDGFESRYLEFPLKVEDIIRHSLYQDEHKPRGCGDLVAVRPCDEELAGKTYIGLLVGEMPTFIMTSLDDKGELTVAPTMENPCILIPELGRLVWGYESWWRKIESERDFADITDHDIENAWYVRLARETLAAKGIGEE